MNRELNYYYLKAPMDGIITSRDVSRNENVQPGQVVVVLETGDLIEVQVGIPELSISRIEKGQEVAVQFPTVPGAEFKGLVNEVSYSIVITSYSIHYTKLYDWPASRGESCLRHQPGPQSQDRWKSLYQLNRRPH